MIFLSGLMLTLLFFLVLFWFFSATNNKQAQSAAVANSAKSFSISSKDIETIAGDDLMRTQLDLARAYLETDRKNLAKSILNNVLLRGNSEQKEEAKGLLAAL